MRAVVKVKQSQGRTPSNAARYIAESKLDPEREGDKPRPLFTNKGHDDLTYRKANGFLTGGRGAPIRNDLIHFSVSFRNEDFEALGPDGEKRKELLREAAREAMDEFRSDLRVDDWRWVAGIHLNTPYPHIHFLGFKETVTDRGKPRRLGRIPKRFLPYREGSPDGAGRPVEGKLGEAFVAALDRAQQRVAPERGGQDMARTLLSNTLEFDSPLVHQGIEYRTVDNFYQAMKTQKDDIETRRKIAAASPEEAKALGERVKARPDWPEIRLQVLETALRHKFAPGTRWHARLRATGDMDILDGSKENRLGALLMRLRDGRERVITSDDILLEANRRNPSLAGRELVQELILRGPAPEPVSSPEALGDIREALKDRQADDPYYNSQPDKADWLGERSQELRDLYERGATIKENVLVIPAEEHELNNLTADRPPFINERRYAHQEIPDQPEKAGEFYELAKAIAGKTANTKTEIDYFRYFYKQIRQDGEGRYLKPDQKEAREEALERTLVEMRSLAGDMEKLETLVSDEGFRFPAVLTFEDRKSLVEIHLPNVDAKIEAGRREAAILGDINRMVEDWNRKLSETGAARQKLSDKYDSIGYFLKAYVKERLKDPETRATGASEAFRNAHERITEARTPEELNRAARVILKGADFSWRERALLFFGRAPAHHTREMRELRHFWGLTRDERVGYVKALGEGRREPSPALDKLLTELETRTSARAISHYRASILNEEMRTPGKLDLRAMYERLPAYERDYLYKKIEERAEAGAFRQPSLRESAPELGAYGESFRQYSEAVAETERRLIDETIRQKQPAGEIGREVTPADGLLTREDRLRIRAVASGLAWERPEPQRIFTDDPAVMKLLSLDEAVARLRDETQPQAREAAQRLDEFIRSRGLGDVIIAQAMADCATLDYETARDYGRTFRFSVRYESLAADRRISSLDVHRRAGARGDRAADDRGAERKDDRAAR